MVHYKTDILCLMAAHSLLFVFMFGAPKENSIILVSHLPSELACSLFACYVLLVSSVNAVIRMYSVLLNWVEIVFLVLLQSKDCILM